MPLRLLPLCFHSGARVSRTEAVPLFQPGATEQQRSDTDLQGLEVILIMHRSGTEWSGKQTFDTGTGSGLEWDWLDGDNSTAVPRGG